MADLNVFGESDFDAKKWINQACSLRPDDEALDRFLAETEMRLQLAAEEIEAGLQDSSSQALRRIPFAVQEIYRLQGDIQGMQDQVKVLAGQVARDASDAAESVSTIAKLDHVKKNMESACSTLKEATELSGLFIKVEEVFAAGDLPRAAETLGVMRRSLALVGDVPEFRAGRGRLAQLEDKLQGLVEGSLAESLAKPALVVAASTGADAAGAAAAAAGEEHVRQLAALLLTVERYSTVEQLYVDARVSYLMGVWDEVCGPRAAGGADILTTLPRFYTRALPVLQAEAAWAARVLPGQAAQLTTALLRAVLLKVAGVAKEALAGSRAPVAALAPFASEVVAWARGLGELLPSSLPHDIARGLLTASLEPLEDRVGAYSALEAAALAAELGSLGFTQPTAGTAGLTAAAEAEVAAEPDSDALVRRLSAAVRAAAAAVVAAVERCVALTAGTELPALARVVDEAVAGFVGRLAALVTALHRKQAGLLGGTGPGGGGGVTPPAPGGEGGGSAFSEEVGAVLRLVVLAGEVANGALVRKVDAAVRTAVTAALPKLESAAEKGSSGSGMGTPGGAPLDAVALRLGAAHERLGRVQRLASSLAEPRFVALPGASAAADGLSRSVQAAAYDALLGRVRVALRGVGDMPEWRKGGSEGAAGMALPTFSAYPLQYVTSVGEYLMEVPQLLELLMSDTGGGGSVGSGGGAEGGAAGGDGSTMQDEEREELAAAWLDRVVSGAAAAYAEALAAIPELSAQGGVQLAADVEYFCNVMSALHVMPPPALLTLQLFAGVPRQQFGEAARAAVSEGGVDVATLKALAGMRKIALDM